MLCTYRNIWQINFNCVFVFVLATQNSYICFYIINTIDILTADNLLVAAYASSCLCIPVSNAVVEWVCSSVTSVFKMEKLFACFLSCVHGVFNCPVATPAHRHLGRSPSLQLRFIHGLLNKQTLATSVHFFESSEISVRFGILIVMTVFVDMRLRSGADPGGGAIGAIFPPKTYKSNFFHHDFVQFGKQHSR